MERLADAWGVSTESLRRLGIGFDAGAYTFPMRNARGEIVGIRKRDYENPAQKYAVKTSTNGLFVPAAKTPSLESSRCLQASSWASDCASSDNAPARGQEVFLGLQPGGIEIITEGESDLAAALTWGFSSIGRPNARGATAEVVAFLKDCLTVCPCIQADNDEIETGKAGAEILAGALVAAGVPCRVLTPPGEFKDLRAWLRGGLTAEALRKAIDRQPIRWPDCDPPGFVQVPNRLLRCVAFAGISPGAFKLACTIQAFYSPGRKPFPPREELAKLLGVHPGTVDHWKQELKRAGILKWTRGRTGRANEYRVNFGPVRGSKKRQEAGAAQGSKGRVACDPKKAKETGA